MLKGNYEPLVQSPRRTCKDSGGDSERQRLECLLDLAVQPTGLVGPLGSPLLNLPFPVNK